MDFTNFPRGFPFGVTLRNLPILNTYPAQCFWVDSNAGRNSGAGTLERPFATIDYAIGRCRANKGDIIMVKAGHVETITAAAGIACDVAGISIIGHGNGSDRPTINFTTSTAATMTISAANILLQNLLFIGGVDALVSPIVVSAADVTMIGCETRDTAGTAQATDWILTTAAANRFSLLRHRHDGDPAAGANTFLAIVGGDGIVVDGLRLDGNFAIGGISVRTTATTDLEVRNVMFRTRNAADIFLVDTITGSTGMIGPGLYLRLNDNAANITEAITGATWVLFDDIFVVNLAGEKAMLINTTASTDA